MSERPEDEPVAIGVIEVGNVIEAGCYVTWRRDREFIEISNYKSALREFQKKYGFGPFLVKNVKVGEKGVLLVVSTELGDGDIEPDWLQVVPVFPSPLVC